MPLDPSLISRAIPTGSARYYSLRFSAPSVRQDLQLLLVWYHAVSTIPALVSDQQVAQAKLSWWHHELHQAMAGKSDLPLANGLSTAITKYQLPLEAFEQIVEMVMHDLAQNPHDNWSSFDRYGRRLGGNFATLLARVCGAEDEQALELARKLGGFIRQVEVIQELGLSLRRYSNPIPTTLMQQHGLSQHLLDSEERPQQLSKLLREMADRLRQTYSENTLLIGDLKPQLLPVLIQAELANALLNTLERSDFMVLDQRISLTPLQKVWLAWRCSRRRSPK